MFFNVSAKKRIDSPKPAQSYFFQKPLSGITVNNETAFTYSAFYACMRIISETIAYLPWHVILGGTKREIAADNSLDDILYRRPNDEMNGFTFKELMVQNLLGWGNAYAEIERNRLGEIMNLWPIDPDCVNPDRDSKGRLFYEVSSESGGNIPLSTKDVFAVRGPSRDGIVGHSIIQNAKESIGLGLATEAFGAAFFGNGAVPLTVITNDGSSKISPEGVKNLLSTFNKKNKGVKNAMKTEYLDAGMKIQSLGIPPGDAQFLESRKFQIQEICRWFRIPPHKLADLERSTHTNIEAQNIEFVTDSCMPWISRLENQANFSLIQDPANYYTKMNVLGLLRGDSKARADYYKTLANLGVLSIDEIRDREDMDSIGADGDLRLVPMNMTTPQRAKSGDLTPNKAVASNLMKETAARFVKIELTRVKKLASKGDLKGLADFYVAHATALADGFNTVSSLVCADESKKEGNLIEFFGKYIENSAETMQNAIESGSIDAVISSWEARKADNLARDLMGSLANV